MLKPQQQSPPLKTSALTKRVKTQHPTMHQMLKFGAVGIIALIVDVGMFNLAIILGTNSYVAKIISTTIAVCLSYLGNKVWSFRGSGETKFAGEPFRGNRKTLTKETLKYAVVNIIAMFVALIPLYFNREILGNTSILADNIAVNMVGLALGTLVRFYGYKKWVFAT